MDSSVNVWIDRGQGKDCIYVGKDNKRRVVELNFQVARIVAIFHAFNAFNAFNACMYIGSNLKVIDFTVIQQRDIM